MFCYCAKFLKFLKGPGLRASAQIVFVYMYVYGPTDPRPSSSQPQAQGYSALTNTGWIHTQSMCFPEHSGKSGFCIAEVQVV